MCTLYRCRCCRSSNRCDIKDYPQAYQNFKSEISLPIYPQLDSEKLNFIIETVKAAYATVIAENR